MARWRQSVELAMTDEEARSDCALAKRGGASGGTGANAAYVP